VELPTYSAVFGFEKRLYAIYDLELPVPVSLFQAGVFLLALAATLATTTIVGIGLSAASAWVFVVPPATAAYLASRPLADGKRPHHWLASQVRHLTEPRTLVRLRPDRSPSRIRPRGSVHVVRREVA
jgi:hypothetical protein